MTERDVISKPGFNDNENPLLRLYLRRSSDGSTYIDADQFAAGEKLRSDFERSQMSPRVTMAYQEPSSTGGRHWQSSDNHVAALSDHTLVARDRFHAALQEVGPELSGILYNVVCLATGLEHAERRLALPPRSGKAVLSLALTRLARHYGLKRRPEKSQSTSVWHTDDYRPAIMPPQPAGHRT